MFWTGQFCDIPLLRSNLQFTLLTTRKMSQDILMAIIGVHPGRGGVFSIQRRRPKVTLSIDSLAAARRVAASAWSSAPERSRTTNGRDIAKIIAVMDGRQTGNPEKRGGIGKSWAQWFRVQFGMHSNSPPLSIQEKLIDIGKEMSSRVEM